MLSMLGDTGFYSPAQQEWGTGYSGFLLLGTWPWGSSPDPQPLLRQSPWMSPGVEVGGGGASMTCVCSL